MNESPSSGHSPDFLAEVERLLKPMYAECFTDETRKVRDLLLVISVFLILLAFGVIAVDRAPFQIPPLGLPITVTTGMRGLLIVLCLYFLVSFSTRAYAEWKWWRLRHQAPIDDFLDLETKIESSWQDLISEANKTLRSSWDVLKKQNELYQEPHAISQLTEEFEDLSKKYKRLSSEIKEKRDLLEWSEIKKLHDHRDRIVESIRQVGDQLRKERTARRDEIALESGALARKLAELEDRYRRQTDAPDLEVLEAQLGYLHDAVRPVKKILSMRRWFEALFPISFGIVAIVLGFVVHKTG